MKEQEKQGRLEGVPFRRYRVLQLEAGVYGLVQGGCHQGVAKTFSDYVEGASGHHQI